MAAQSPMTVRLAALRSTALGLAKVFSIVSAASVSRWRALERRQGDARPGPLGGDRRSGRVEAQAGLILRLLEETPDITIEELRRALAGHGHRFGYGTTQRFFARHRITREKRPRTPASRTDRTS